MRDVRLKNMVEQHQGEVAILKAKISSNAGNYNQSNQYQANNPVIPTNQNQCGSNKLIRISQIRLIQLNIDS